MCVSVQCIHSVWEVGLSHRDKHCSPHGHNGTAQAHQTLNTAPLTMYRLFVFVLNAVCLFNRPTMCKHHKHVCGDSDACSDADGLCFVFLIRKQYKRVLSSVVTIQKNYRAHFWRRVFLRLRLAAVVLQKHHRGRLARSLHRQLKEEKLQREEEERRRQEEEERRRLEEERRRRMEEEKRRREEEEERRRLLDEEMKRKEELRLMKEKEEEQKMAAKADEKR